jgi:hypothetical protein
MHNAFINIDCPLQKEMTAWYLIYQLIENACVFQCCGKYRILENYLESHLIIVLKYGSFAAYVFRLCLCGMMSHA